MSCLIRRGGIREYGVKNRAAERFRLNLPMTVRWTTQSGIAEAHTYSRDVSSRGIYFFLQKQIEDNSHVEIVLTFPDEIQLTGQGRTRVYCRGRVRRTEVMESDRIGVAAQIERYRFLGAKEGERSLRVVKT